MARYIVKRLLLMIPVLLGISLIVFCISGYNPDPVVWSMVGQDATPEEFEAEKIALGLDRHVLVRYVEYMGGLLRGDLGTSYRNGSDVFKSWAEAMPLTLRLSMASVFVSVIISLPLGIISALKRGTLTDNVSMVAALIGLATPNFWLGLMLIVLFSVNLGWFPTGGARDGIMSFILPAITVGTGMTATLTRQTRASMLTVIRSDYLRTARAKGVSERRVILYHALRNALIPIITVIGGQIAGTLGGSALTETVFALPGAGRILVTAINNYDFMTVTGNVLMQSMITAIILLTVDLLYALVDPRIKAQFAKGGKKNG